MALYIFFHWDELQKEIRMPLWIDHKSPNHQVEAGIPWGRGDREKQHRKE